MGKDDEGLARNTMDYQSGVDWRNEEIVAKESIKAKKSSRRELSHYDRDIAE